MKNLVFSILLIFELSARGGCRGRLGNPRGSKPVKKHILSGGQKNSPQKRSEKARGKKKPLSAAAPAPAVFALRHKRCLKPLFLGGEPVFGLKARFLLFFLFFVKLKAQLKHASNVSGKIKKKGGACEKNRLFSLY